jgi:uncharacterized protein (DUF2249 family)
MTEATTTLDVRSVDGEPFGHIQDALADLPDDGSLLLVNSFEPEPLYNVLEAKGFTHETTQVADEEWHVHIEPE